MKNKKASEIKWSDRVKMSNDRCPNGKTWDGKNCLPNVFSDLKNTMLNPYNWGVSDYTKSGTRSQAFAAARKDGEEEFLWNGKRYNTRKDTDRIKITGDNPDIKNYAESLRYNYPEFYKTLNRGRNVGEISSKGLNPEEPNRGFMWPGKTDMFVGVGEKPNTFADFRGTMIAESGHVKNPSMDGNILDNLHYAYEHARYGDDAYNIPGTKEYNDHRLREPGMAMIAYGNLSPNDIKRIQKHLGVKVDGYFGPKTYKALQNKYDKDLEIEYEKTKLKLNTGDLSSKNILPKNDQNPIGMGRYGEGLSKAYLSLLNKDVPLKGIYRDNQLNRDQQYTWDSGAYSDKALLNASIEDMNILELQQSLADRGIKLPKSTNINKGGNYGFDGVYGEETKNALEKYRKDYQQKTVDKTKTELSKLGVKSWNQKQDGGPMNQFAAGGQPPCGPGLIFLKAENKCVSATYYAFKNKDLSASTIKDHLEANNNFSNAVTWMKNWQTSPMYKKMLYNSTVVKNNGDKTEYNKINEQRNANLLSIPPVEIKKTPFNKNKKLDNTSGISWDNDGRVEIFPMGLKLKTLPVHEVTHSVHRTNNPPASELDMTMTIVRVDKKTGKKTIVTDDNTKKNKVNNKIAIPVSNQEYINEHKATNFFQSQEYINNKKKYDAFNKNPNKKNKDGLSFKDFLEGYKKGADYVGTSTETIGRLNAIRERSQKEKLYDPFTEEVSPELFKNTLKNYKFEEDELWDPMYQLKKTYSDDEIIYMLNNISKNEVQQEQVGAEGQAKNGGSIKWSANTKMNNGGFIAIENPLIADEEQKSFLTNTSGPRNFQDGDDKDAMTGMMKARLAYANEFGNPAAKRMINLPDEPYEFTGDEPGAGVPAGNTGTHFMGSMDNYAVPFIQQGPNGLYYNQNAGPKDEEAIKFDSDKAATYFAENYKDVSPAFLNEKHYGGLHKMPDGGSIDWPPASKNKTYLTYSPFYGNSLTGQSSNMGYADNPFSDEKSDFFKVNTVRMPQSYIGISGGADPYGKFNHNDGIMKKLSYDAYVGLPYNYDPNNTNYYSNTPSVGGRIRFNNSIKNQWLGIPWNKVYVEASGDYSQSDGLNANFSLGTRFDGKKGNSRGYFEPHLGVSGSWGPHNIKPGAYSAAALAEYQAIMGSNEIPDLEGDSVNMSDPMIQNLISGIYNENIENPLAKGKKQQGAMGDIDLGFKTGFEWQPKWLTKRLPGSKIFGDLRYSAQPMRGMWVSGMGENSQNSVGNYNGVQTSLSDQSETNKLSFSHQFTGGLGLKVPIGTVKNKINNIDFTRTRIPKDCMCPDGTKVDRLEDGSCPCDDYQIEECPPCPDGSIPQRLKDGTCPCDKDFTYPDPDEWARHPRWLKKGGVFKKLGADVKWPTLENYDDGGIYTFPGRPGSYYKQQSDGTYLIKNNKTNGQYIKMNDPDGTRTKTLNAGRVEYKKPVQTQITPGNTQVAESTKINNIYQKPLSTINYNPNVNALTNQTIPLSNTKPQVDKPKSVVTTNFNINTTDQVKKANAITKEKEIQEDRLANERMSKNALPEREITQEEFEANQWKKYNKLDWASKLLDRGKAFGVDPLGMFSRVVTGEQGYIPGMGDGIFSENEDEKNKFLRSMNYTPGKFEASDIQNIVNPFYWGASAGSKIGDGLFNSKDEYGNHKVDFLKTGLGVGEAVLAFSSANKVPEAVNQFTSKVAPKVQKVSDIITKAGKNYDLFRKTPIAEMVGQGWKEIAWNGSKKLGTSNFANGRVFGNLSNNIIGNTVRGVSPYVTPSNAARVYAGYKAGKGVLDGSTLHKNQEVYDDIKNGNFNAGNLYDAASADLKLASAIAAPFTNALDFKVIKGLDKVANYGVNTSNPFNYDSYAKGFFKLNESLNKKNGGIITNNILIKYPQMHSANKKLDQFFNGGTI